jgi:hypothetical protein
MIHLHQYLSYGLGCCAAGFGVKNGSREDIALLILPRTVGPKMPLKARGPSHPAYPVARGPPPPAYPVARGPPPPAYPVARGPPPPAYPVARGRHLLYLYQYLSYGLSRCAVRFAVKGSPREPIALLILSVTVGPKSCLQIQPTNSLTHF